MLFLSTREYVQQFILENHLTQPQHQTFMVALPATDASQIHKNLIRVSRELKAITSLYFPGDIVQPTGLYRYVFLNRSLSEVIERLYETIPNGWHQKYLSIYESSADYQEFESAMMTELTTNLESFNTLDVSRSKTMQYQDYVQNEQLFMIELCRFLFS